MTSARSPAIPCGFERFELHPDLLRAVHTAGWEVPRPIQAKTIPAALEGRDVLGLAQTGTGKTAAFALPVLAHLIEERRRGPRVLVVAPTRELALQIEEDFRTLARFTAVRTVTVYGGVSERRQIDTLRRHPDVIVACPGRLLDLYRQGHVCLDRVETLVLDEADHMFDMGFLPDVRRILAALPPRRQNLLFSATMPREIRGLAGEVLHNPVVVELGHSRPAETIEHALYPVDETRKLALLEHLLHADGIASALVFTRTKHRARRVARDLEKAGFRAVALQGNMSQNARDRAMKGFRTRRYDILVATDIVSRGIDVEQISHVINFDVPNTPDAYTHRIGRTGRAERSGRAYTFVSGTDGELVHEIERKVGARIPRVAVPGFEVSPAHGRPSVEHRSRRGARPAFPARGGPQNRGRATRRRSR